MFTDGAKPVNAVACHALALQKRHNHNLFTPLAMSDMLWYTTNAG